MRNTTTPPRINNEERKSLRNENATMIDFNHDENGKNNETPSGLRHAFNTLGTENKNLLTE